MNGSHDTQQDHGRAQRQPSQTQKPWDSDHSGHGAASALARYKQKQERRQAEDPDASGGRGQ